MKWDKFLAIPFNKHVCCVENNRKRAYYSAAFVHYNGATNQSHITHQPFLTFNRVFLFNRILVKCDFMSYVPKITN